MYEIILFDLDGTITDSGLGITNSVAYALKKMNIEIGNRSTLYKFIGPPLRESFMQLYNVPEDHIKTAIAFYREYYQDKGMFENKVYEGIEELLKALKTSNKKLVVATSKPELFATKILKYFNLTQYFDAICGANMDETRIKKDEVIQYAIETVGATDTSRILMVGDREHDVLGAKKHKIDVAGVLFGFGSRDELKEAGATYIVKDVSELKKICLRKVTNA